MPSVQPVRLGISACLLGEAVRYDGGHKRDSFLNDTLGRFVEWVPVCFMSALQVVATPRRHVNVLQHVAGYFKDRLDRDSKAELGAAIDEYRRGLVPLIVPIALIRHHVRRHDVAYLADQLYLEPHPKELMLRNHV